MPLLKYSERFKRDLASVTSPKVDARIDKALDNIEAFIDFGNPNVPQSIKGEFGSGVRYVAVNPFDLVYTANREEDTAYIEALIPQRMAR